MRVNTKLEVTITPTIIIAILKIVRAKLPLVFGSSADPVTVVPNPLNPAPRPYILVSFLIVLNDFRPNKKRGLALIQ